MSSLLPPPMSIVITLEADNHWSGEPFSSPWLGWRVVASTEELEADAVSPTIPEAARDAVSKVMYRLSKEGKRIRKEAAKDQEDLFDLCPNIDEASTPIKSLRRSKGSGRKTESLRRSVSSSPSSEPPPLPLSIIP